MAKQISQQTFDDVVRENMEDFEMDVEEAIQDAVQQFETQGVNLNNLVKDPSLYTGGSDNVTHAIIDALQKLSIQVDEPTPKEEEIISALHTIHTECDIDLARRCLAGKNDAYPIFMKTYQKYRVNADVLKCILKSFCSLVNGQPDLLDDKGCTFLVELLSDYKTNADILELIVKVIRLCCIKHEGNRQMFVSKNLITILADLLDQQKKTPLLVKEVSFCVRVLTFDDDVRVPFGKAHEHAKVIVTEGNALKTILNICQEYKEDIGVLSELFSTLSRLAVRDEFCGEVMDLGGLGFILQAFENNLDEKGITKQALTVLKALAGNDNVKVSIVKSGGIELIVAAMTRHAANAAIADAACAALTTLMLRNPSHAAKVMECQGHQQIIQVMKIHSTNASVQKQACMALRNLVVRSEHNCKPILELGAELLINEARVHDKSLDDEAKAALRDLGCKVELRELWKGKKSEIQH